MNDLGHPMTTEEAVKVSLGSSLTMFWHWLKHCFRFRYRLICRRGAAAPERFRREPASQGVREVLSALPYPLRGVVIHAKAPIVARSDGLAELFGDRVFSVEQVGRASRPDLYLAARSVGARPADCIVIED
jgi:beta-phosphoglucomutase-like phosphatase (HAD superfamily)